MSNQTRTPIETVRRILNSKIQRCENKIALGKEKQESDFAHAFEWGYIADRYSYEYFMYHLNILLKRTEDENFMEFLTYYYKEMIRRIAQFDPTNVSTSEYSNFSVKLKHKVYAGLWELCDTLINEMDKTV